MKLLALAAILVSAIVSAAAAEGVKQPRFGIYMPKLDVYTPTMDVTERVIAYQRTSKPDEIPLAEFPIISDEDLLSYDWETHTLELHKSRWFMIRQPSSHGIPFVVVVDGTPIYVGSFWSEYSSIPSSVPTIMWDGRQTSKTMTIGPGSRATTSADRDDPRSNEKLKQVLKELGKLKTATQQNR
jgi:hypothetical protein